MGIDQIIDRHQVETGVELLEKEVFRPGEVQHAEQGEKEQTGQQPLVPARLEHPLRHQEQVKGGRSIQIDQYDQVVEHAGCQNGKKIFCADLLGKAETPPQQQAQKQRQQQIDHGQGEQGLKS